MGGVKSGNREKKGDWDCWVGGILVCFEVVEERKTERVASECEI